MNQKSSLNYIEKNQIASNSNGMHVYGESNENIILANNLSDNNVGISIQDAFKNSFYDSLKSFGNKKDAHITVGINENEIKR